MLPAFRSIDHLPHDCALRPPRRTAVPADRARVRAARAPVPGRSPGRPSRTLPERNHACRSMGAEHIERDRAAVYAVNHTSNVEPPIIFDTLHELFPRLRILYKAELRKLPVLVRAFDLAGFIPLERANPEQSLPAIDRAAEAHQGRQLVPDLSRRHAQSHGRAPAVQEGRIHPGHQGAGAGGAHRHQRGEARDAEGKPADLSGHRPRSDW